jgi:hypothetical protein
LNPQNVYFTKIKQLHIGNKKSFRVLLLAELILLLLPLIGFIGENKIYQYSLNDMTVRYGTVTEDMDGVYTDASYKTTGILADFENISLPLGTYRVCLQYETDTNMINSCTVSDVTLGYKSLLTNGDLLYEGLNQTDFEMWLFRGTRQLIVHTTYGGEGSLTVKGLTIYETDALTRMCIFVLLCLFVCINLVYVFCAYDRTYGVRTETKTVILGLIITSVFASFPMLSDYIVSTGDTTFHLWRIEGMKDALLTGQFPVRISSEWQYGYGYAAPIFYGETFLWPAALLRIIGFPIDISYRMYVTLISTVTVLVAYICFKRILKSGYLGLFSSALYSVSVYRIHKTYIRGTLGEAIAMMLLPLLVYGFYNVFTGDTDDGSYKYNYIPLMIGFSGLLQSHLLTGEMAGAFTVLLCIVMIRKVFRKKTFIVLAKTVIYSLLISAWFVVPFADYTLTGDFVIQHALGRRIQERGIYPAQVFRTFFSTGSNVHFAVTGAWQGDAIGIGMALVAVLAVWFFLEFFGYTKQMDTKYRNTARVLALMSTASMIVSLSIFPWDKLQFLSQLTDTLVSSLQFPDRLLTIASLCLSLLAGIIGKYLSDKKVIYRVAYFVGVMALMACGSLYLLSSVMYTTQFNRIYNEEGMGFGYVSGGEYLPYGTDTSKFTFSSPSGESINITSYTRNGLTLYIDCQNIDSEEHEMEVPLLYYKGYRAIDKTTGRQMNIYSGENFVACVTVPAYFEGEIEVRFVSPWYWRAAEAVSLITIIALGVAAVCRKRRKYSGRI